jgi:hypothetical protein
MRQARTCFRFAAVAAVAMLALAGSASAAEFHTSAGSAHLTGIQTTINQIAVTGGVVECDFIKLSGTSAAQSFHPEYTGCDAFGFTGATVDSTGCQFVYDANSSNYALANCASGGITIDVTVPLVKTRCHVLIPNQSGINGVTFENQSGNLSFVIKTASTNLKAEVLDSTGLCPLAKATHANATYSGHTKYTANYGSTEFWRL